MIGLAIEQAQELDHHDLCNAVRLCRSFPIHYSSLGTNHYHTAFGTLKNVPAHATQFPNNAICRTKKSFSTLQCYAIPNRLYVTYPSVMFVGVVLTHLVQLF
ncbi:hypothetical protein AVEN_892-1 [Araneus ventricosus]|uniref:Uncharacterized protein n=1 Tax=Araneus ventricosus TaxID=182803 RepID=A0A4Y2DSL1_ARAVE|nr:hypothetical protein AVEN_892-1 [Araneus ventricosus]